MKRIVGVICVVVAASVGVSLAGAATTPAWSVAKAELMLKREATVGLPLVEKVRLEDKLRTGAAMFRGLEIWALDEGDENAWWTYHNYADVYERALRSVRNGLRIERAACAGSGRAIQAKRFKQFDCLATSEAVSIPSAEVSVSAGSGLPSVVEGEGTLVGPFFVQIRVRVTGRSTFAYE